MCPGWGLRAAAGQSHGQGHALVRGRDRAPGHRVPLVLRLSVLRRQAMKRMWAVLAVAALGLVPVARAADSAKTILAIKGMTCGGCVAAVKVQLKRTEGVAAYDVSLEKAEADVTYDPAKTDPEKVAESVSKTGFEASVKEPAESKKAK